MYAPGIKHRGVSSFVLSCFNFCVPWFGPSFYIDFQTSSSANHENINNLSKSSVKKLIHRNIIGSFMEMAILLQRNDAVSLTGSVST